jgi:hypothetical protein
MKTLQLSVYGKYNRTSTFQEKVLCQDVWLLITLTTVSQLFKAGAYNFTSSFTKKYRNLVLHLLQILVALSAWL